MITVNKYVHITFEGDSVKLLRDMAEICRIRLYEGRATLSHIDGTARGGAIDKLLETIFEL